MLETTTLPLAVLSAEAKAALLGLCDEQEALAAKEERAPDAYFQKVRDRLNAVDDGGKVTIPNVLLTEDVRAAIKGYMDGLENEAVAKADDLAQKSANPDKAGIKAAVLGAELHPYHEQAKERLALLD
jgi:hypothetical protein